MLAERITPDSPHWPDLIAHLKRTHDAEVVLTQQDQPAGDIYYLALIEESSIIGHIALKVQDITIPAAHGHSNPLLAPDCSPLRESFALTFSIEEPYRRKGHGRALQEAALSLSQQLGCYQMRSWSPLDQPANYALKIKLGFSAHPAVNMDENGQPVSGVYFVKKV